MAFRHFEALPTDDQAGVTKGSGSSVSPNAARLVWDDTYTEQQILAAIAKIRLKMVPDTLL